MANNIHWFPGHMSKALKEIENRLKIIDVVIEILDARAPYSSMNKNLEKLIANKKKILILSKPDLADPTILADTLINLKKKFDIVLDLNLTNPNSEKALSKAVAILGKDKWQKEISKGMKPQPIRTMIIGIPNVGKSSLINRLAKRNIAGVQNKPGYTKGEQWIKVNKDFLLLDTPGVLPMNYDEQQDAIKLALVGSVREDILPNHILVEWLIKYLKMNYPDSLKNRFNIETITDVETVINAIAANRGLKASNGQYDISRSEYLLLKEFKEGLLGRISLEK